MTLTEIQTVTLGSVRMPALIHEPPKDVDHGSPVAVVDCPASAWDESDKAAILDLRNTFGDDLVDTYESELRRAAHVLIETHLDAEWGNRDFVVVYVRDKSAFESGATPGPDGTPYFVPADETYHQVWQAAADAVTDKDLVHEAKLGHVFGFRTELGRHRDSLNHKLAQLRAELAERVEAFGETAESMQAEQQYEGWQAAVENAVTREQLLRVSADMPF